MLAIEPAARTKEMTHPCFTGAQYRIFSIDYDNRKLGKAVLGPFLPAEVTSVPDALLAVDPKIDANRALELLPRMPRAKADAITLICDHLRRTLDLILGAVTSPSSRRRCTSPACAKVIASFSRRTRNCRRHSIGCASSTA